MLQHTVGIHGVLVGDDLNAHLRLGEPVLHGVFRAFFHIGDPLHKCASFAGGRFFGAGQGNGSFSGEGSVLPGGGLLKYGGSFPGGGDILRHGNFLCVKGFRGCWLYAFGDGGFLRPGGGRFRLRVGGKEGKLLRNDFLLVPLGELSVVHTVFLPVSG